MSESILTSPHADSHTVQVDAAAVVAGSTPPLDPGPQSLPEAARELLQLAFPFILSASFTTIQVFIDRIFISAVSPDAVAAAMPTIGYFWTPMALFQFTVLYVTVFVAQYTGAGRPSRVGPVVWQGLYFALIAGLIFPLFIPFVDAIIGWTDHDPAVKVLESAYFHGLSLSALPMLLVAAVSAFFAGRQQSWTVLAINGLGAAVNAACAVPLILWNRENPEAAMFGAGLAAAIGSTVSAVLGLVLFFRPKFRAIYGTVSGWRFDGVLFRRLMYYGLPNGAQFCMEGLAFTIFILLIGNLGRAELAASTLTFSLNLLTFLPVMGLGQGVEVLVGRRQGESRPDLSARTTHAGALLATLYMIVLAILYFTVPNVMIAPFKAEMKPEDWAAVGPLIPILLRFVAGYSLADGANIIYAYALRGAGDTRYVTFLAIVLSWPIMVIPTYFCWKYGWGLQAAWAFATAYVVILAIAFWLRFLGGRWRTMRVIEAAIVVDSEAESSKVES